MSEERIAYLVSQYPAYNHTFILREIRLLRRQGFVIPVISIRKPDRPPEQCTAEEQEELGYTRAVLGTSLLSIAGIHLRAFLIRPSGYLRGLAATLRLSRGAPREIVSHLFYFAEAVVAGSWMRQERCKHFHTHFASTVGLLITKIYPLTMSITLHGPDEFKEPSLFHLREKIEASRLLSAISHYARSQMMLAAPPKEWGKMQVHRLGVDPHLFAPAPFRVAPDVFALICVGRLAPVKAQSVLLEALVLLKQRNRRFHLRLLGDGPDRAMLEQQTASLGLQEEVSFAGVQNQDRVRALYQETDLMVLASFAEGVPVVLMEAMAMEIACVATGITGVPELIRPEMDGLLTPPGDAGALAAAIERLMDDPELRRRLGQSARKQVMEHYDLSRNVKALGAALRPLISS